MYFIAYRFVNPIYFFLLKVPVDVSFSITFFWSFKRKIKAMKYMNNIANVGRISIMCVNNQNTVGKYITRAKNLLQASDFVIGFSYSFFTMPPIILMPSDEENFISDNN